jgi:hypothetical protein
MQTWKSGGIPYGYRFNKDTKTIEVFPAESAIVKLILSLAMNDGFGISKIANYLNTHGYKTRRGKSWYEITVGYVLAADRLKFYRGFYKTGEAGNWPRLITEEQFTALMSLKKKKRILGKRQSYLLTGWGGARCGLCGSKLRVAKTPIHDYYICTGRLSKGKDTCDAKTYRQDAVNKAILTHIRSVTGKFNSYYLSYLEATRARIEKQTKLLKKRDKKYFTELPAKLNDIQDLLKMLMLPKPPAYRKDFTDMDLLTNYVKSVTIKPDHIEIEYFTPFNAKLEFTAVINY